MGTKRYFYTDPLAAAWMAKHFGMRFQQFMLDRTEEANEVLSELTECDILDDVFESHPSNYYIHPDSLHLLEPKAGDTLRVGDAGCIARYCGADQANHFIQIITPGSSSNANWTDQVYGLRVNGTDIIVIQRDGKPLMWPESEAA